MTAVPRPPLAAPRPVPPRARGAARVEARLDGPPGTGRTRLHGLRQEGSLRVLFPRARDGALEAVLLNTAGGLTGGDRLAVAAEARAGARLVLSTQAAERAYRAPGLEPARAEADLRAGEGARLHWLPQETILFEGSRLRRAFRADLDPSATLLAVEPLVLGRRAGGEVLRGASLLDRWEVRRGGRLVLADALRLEGDLEALMDRAAVGAGARALATILLVGPAAEAALAPARAALAGAPGGASLVRDGVLVARLLAPDSLTLRRTLVPLITRLAGAPPPRVWAL